MPPRGKPISIPWPAQGLDSVVKAGSVPLRTRVASNVRNYTRTLGKEGGGKREGLAKLFAAGGTVGESGARRINGLHVMPMARITPSDSDGTWRDAVIDHDTLDAVLPAATTPFEYINLGEHWVVFRKDHITHASHFASGNYLYRRRLVSGVQYLELDWNDADANNKGYPGVAAAFATDNDVTMVLHANRQCSADVGLADEGTALGPFCRGAGGLGSFLGACLLYTAANTVKLSIVEVSAGTRTTRMQSAALTLDASATLTDDLSIRIYSSPTGDRVTAELDWPSAGFTGATAVTITYATTFNQTSTRGGIAALFTSGVMPASTVASRWRIASITTRVRVPIDPAIIGQIVYGQTRTPEPLAYFIPSGWTAATITTAGTLTTQAGGAAGDEAASTPVWPSINRPFGPTAGTGVNRSFHIDRTTTGGNYAVETKGGGGELLSVLDLPGSWTRGSTNRSNGLRVDYTHSSGEASRYAASQQMNLRAIQLIAVVNGAETALVSYSVNQIDMPPVRADGWVRVTDAGGALGTLTVSYGGVTIFSYVPSSSGSWSAPIAAALTGSTSGGCLNGTGAQAGGIRLVQTQAGGAGDSNGRIIAATKGYIDTAVLSEETWSRATGTGLLNPGVQIAALLGLWYAVDGESSRVIDPLAGGSGTCSPWEATAGALPAACRLVCTWRGSIVLARQTANPTLWFKSRVLDPLDWDYGADPEETSASWGGDPRVGQPADPITALIPINEDVLLFGCADSIYQLVGDPNFGGQVNVASTRTGIFGPRTWCRDHQGRIWFLGQSGLFVWADGGAQLVLEGRVPELLEEPDESTTLIQMAYDVVNRCIHIFRTPLDGSAGVHVVFDLDEKAIWTDTYPADQQPWSVAELVGSEPEDRRPLLGGNDGYVRRPAVTAFGDDGTAIAAEIEMVLDPAKGRAEVMAEELSLELSTGSGAVTWSWFTGETTDAVAAMTVSDRVATGTVGGAAGLAAIASLRKRGAAHKLRLEQESATLTFNVEPGGLEVNMDPRSRRRG